MISTPCKMFVCNQLRHALFKFIKPLLHFLSRSPPPENACFATECGGPPLLVRPCLCHVRTSWAKWGIRKIICLRRSPFRPALVAICRRPLITPRTSPRSIRNKRSRANASLMDGQTSLWDAADNCLSVPPEDTIDILDILHTSSYVWKAAKVFHSHVEHTVHRPDPHACW